MTIKMTKKREEILHALRTTHGTLSAAELHAALPHIDLVTIYRNLDLFTKEKIIKQFHLTSDEARYEYQLEPHHHAICEDCERVIHFHAPDKRITKLLNIKNFDVTELEVIVRGKCKVSKK